MAKFIDANGKEHRLEIKSQGQLEDLQEKHGIALDSVFMSDAQGVAELLWMDLRRLSAITASLCGKDGQEAREFERSFNSDSYEQARAALLDAIADFCLCPARRAQAKASIPSILAMNPSLSDGSSKAIESAVSSE